MIVWIFLFDDFALVLFEFHFLGPYDETSGAQAHKVQQYQHFPHTSRGKEHSVEEDIVVMLLSQDTTFSIPTLTGIK